MENKKVTLLLIYPDYLEECTTSKNSGGSYSEGIASISAVVKAAGHNVKLLHLLYPHTQEDFMKKFKEFNCDIAGFSARTTAFPDIREMAKWIKAESDTFVLCGSYHATLVPDEVLKAEGVDCVCVGEGEYPLRELCDRFFEGNFYDIQSMYFKVNGEIIKNPIMPLIENLDDLPIPDFDLFDYETLEHAKLKTALVMMSRGCLFSCTYCGNSQFRQVYPNKRNYARFRSPENAMEYLRAVLKKYPFVEFINFRDAIFNMFDDWFYEFIEMYIKEIHLPFTCNLRLDIMTEETVIKLKQAGCYMIDVGVETGDDDLRKKYLKRMMNNEQMKRAFAWFHKHNITSLTYNIVGLPYEDLTLALSTIKLNVELNPDKVIPNIFYPYPMTILADIGREAGFVPDIIPPGTRVPLVQKQFPEHEVLFAANYFMIFMKLYKGARKLPKFLGVPLEKMYDKIFVGKLTPRKLLNAIYDFKSKMVEGLKRFLINHLPKVYLGLRKMRVKRRQKKDIKIDKKAA